MPPRSWPGWRRETTTLRTAADEYAAQVRGGADDEIARQLAEAEAEAEVRGSGPRRMLSSPCGPKEAENAAAVVRAEAERVRSETEVEVAAMRSSVSVEVASRLAEASREAQEKVEAARQEGRAWWLRRGRSVSGCSPIWSSAGGSAVPSSTTCRITRHG